MNDRDAIFTTLALCAGVPGHPDTADRLRHEIGRLVYWEDLIRNAEDHGLDPLLLAHLHAAGIAAPRAAQDHLQARWMQHAHAHSVRTRVLAEVAIAFERAAIPVLVLKGAALARLVYDTPVLRPMRDVDLLLRRQDLPRALAILREAGFSPKGLSVPARHHHLQGVATTVDGTTITIELHSDLQRPSPFNRRTCYEDLSPRSQPLSGLGAGMRTLGREDMLCHIYAHAFPADVQCFELRLISVADLVAATERWIDELDWEWMARRHGRLLRALSQIERLTLWSSRARLRRADSRSLPPSVTQRRARSAPTCLRAIAASVVGTGPSKVDLFWPPEWWFRLRYGVDGPARWVWYRCLGHPARLSVCFLEMLGTRLRQRVRSRRRSRPRRARMLRDHHIAGGSHDAAPSSNRALRTAQR